MKKIQTLLMMFSLFFLFSFSYAATFTFEEGQYSTYYKSYGVDYDSYIADLENYENLEPNYISPALPDFVVDDSLLEQYPYITFLTGLDNSSKYKYIYVLSDKPLVSISPDSAGFIIGGGTGITTNKTDATSYRIYYSSGSTWSFLQTSTGANHSINAGRSPVYFANYEMLHRDNGSVVIPGGIKPPVMENPLSDAEIKSILEIFLESMKAYGLPTDYERFVLTYNIEDDSYSGYVYSKYCDLSIKYLEKNEETNFWEYFLDSVGPFYSLFMYRDNRPLSYKFNFFNNPQIIEFNSNSDNTDFVFNKMYDLEKHLYSLEDMYGKGDYLVLSTDNEPIIYTSDKIHSLIYVGNWLEEDHFEVDDETSLDYKELTDEEGNVMDNTVSTIEPDTESNVSILSFIGLFFGFIFSLVLFVIRFFAFIVSFVIVPASTTILPPEFVQGIEWLHTFAFGEILLWDIFNILFLVLFSIFLVNLIRSH